MNTTQPCLAFRDGALAIRTPWASHASGAILINGEPVRGEWVADANGRHSCRHGAWQLTITEEPAGVFGLAIANASDARAKLDAVHFARWQPDDFTAPLDVADFRELVHGGSFTGIASGVKCVGRKGLGLDFAAPSNLLTVYQRERGDALLLGVLPPVGDEFSEFRTLHSEPHMEAEFGFEAGFVFNEMEARTYALLVHLTGGDVVLGDALAKLKPNAVAMLERVLEPRTNAAVPVDLFTSDQDLPRVWINRGASDALVGVFNWSDKPARVEFDPRQYGLSGTPADFWTDAPMTALPSHMPRRSSIALRFAH